MRLLDSANLHAGTAPRARFSDRPASDNYSFQSLTLSD